MQYSYSVLNVFDDRNLMPNATWHPKIPGIVYWGMDWYTLIELIFSFFTT